VYLGRILDMKEDRDAAMEQYRAALTAGAALPEVKAAAERGLAQAYEPPTKPQPQLKAFWKFGSWAISGEKLFKFPNYQITQSPNISEEIA
jgi:hypothetical protein